MTKRLRTGFKPTMSKNEGSISLRIEMSRNPVLIMPAFSWNGLLYCNRAKVATALKSADSDSNILPDSTPLCKTVAILNTCVLLFQELYSKPGREQLCTKLRMVTKNSVVPFCCRIYDRGT